MGIDEDTDQKEAALKSLSNMILGGSVYAGKEGDINSTSGVKHKPHTNYGA